MLRALGRGPLPSAILEPVDQGTSIFPSFPFIFGLSAPTCHLTERKATVKFILAVKAATQHQELAASSSPHHVKQKTRYDKVAAYGGRNDKYSRTLLSSLLCYYADRTRGPD